IREAAGNDVAREYSINDAGNQIRVRDIYLQGRDLEALGKECESPEDGYRGQDIIGMARDLVQQEGDSLLSLDREERLARLREFGLKRMLEKIRRDQIGRAHV